MDIPTSGNPVYQINARDAQSDGTSVFLAVRNNDGGIDLDALAEAVRAYLAAEVPNATVSYIDKSQNTDTALYPA
jgi:hypothetical protein